MGQTVEKQSVEERNKEVVRRYREAYNSGDLDALDGILSLDWTTHVWIEGLPRSVEAAKELHGLTLQWCPDWRSTTLDLVAEGDRVVERFLLEGTHAGEFGGLPPTGRRFSVGGLSMFRLQDEKIVEHWAYVDELGFLEALGLPEYLGVELPIAWRWTAHNHTPPD